MKFYLGLSAIVLLGILVSETSSRVLYNSRKQLEENKDNLPANENGVVDIRDIRTYCNFYLNKRNQKGKGAIFYACPKRPGFKYEPYDDTKVSPPQRGSDFEERSHSEKFKCPFPWGNFPHPKYCSKYYLCLFSKPNLKTCASSKLYDEDKEECSEKETVDCGERTGDEKKEDKDEDEKKEQFKCPDTKGKFPHPKDCSKFYVCEKKKPSEKTCATSELYDTKEKECRPKNKVDCGSRDKPKDDDVPFKCPYTWGTFPDPKDCSKYYLCLWKKSSVKKCKSPELYDTKQQECRPKDEVDCGSRYNPKAKSTTSSKVSSSTVPEHKTTSVSTDEEVSSSTSRPKTIEPTTHLTTYTANEVQSTSELNPLTSTIPESTDVSTAPPHTNTHPDATVTHDDKSTQSDNSESTDGNSKTPSEVAEVTTNEGKTNAITTDQADYSTKSDVDKSTRSEQTASTVNPTDGLKTTIHEERTESTVNPTDGLKTTIHEEITESTVNPTDGLKTTIHEEKTASTVNPTDGLETTNVASTQAKELTSDSSESPTDTSTDSKTETETTVYSTQYPETFICLKKNRNYPNPNDCSSYFSCRDGKASLEECPPGTLFSTVDKICYDEQEVDCESRKRPDEDTTIQDTTKDPLIGKSTSNTGTQEETLYSTKETIIEKQTTGNYIYETTEGGTTVKFEITGIPSMKPKERCDPADNTCLIDDNGDIFKCPKAYGHLPHPTNPEKFIHCDNFKIHVMSCSTGTVFNPEHNVCTWPT